MVNVDRHVVAGRAAVEGSVASMNMVKVESWRAVTLGLGRCGHAPRIVEVADSIPLGKECDCDGSHCRNSPLDAPCCWLCRIRIWVSLNSGEPQAWPTSLQADAYTLARTRPWERGPRSESCRREQAERDTNAGLQASGVSELA